MLTFVFLLLGFVFLVKGANLLVDGASSLAKKLRISNLVIGLTIVAFGTSAPELIISVISSLRGASDIAIGNIVGSNISNILLIGGITAMIYPIKVTRGTVWRQIPLSLIAIVLLLVMANDFLLNRVGESVISRVDGILLITFFIAFLYYTFGLSKVKVKDNTEYEMFGLKTSLVYITLGIIGLAIGGKWIVDSATTIATQFGLSDALIGLTILAIGTSLPELATAAVAAFKRNADLAIGNIIGSNIFNIFLVIGVSATIRPLAFNPIFNTDILVGIAATLLLYWFILTGKKDRHIERWEGVALVCFYLVYISFLVWRG